MLVVLRFDSELASLSARSFMARVLAGRIHVSMLLTGYDNRFGHDRTEGFVDYCRYGRELGMEVCCGKALPVPGDVAGGGEDPVQGGATASSSFIRRLLSEGRVGEAALCLGRPYELCGRVVRGRQVGRQIGFPTANIEVPDSQKLIPAGGVYAVMVACDDGSCHHGMTNIGTRPTFHGRRQTLETHIFNYIGDVYGQSLRLMFIDRLRDERPFDTAGALAAQLERDKENAERILENFEFHIRYTSNYST